MKNKGHRARSRAKDHRTSLLGPLFEDNTVFSECAHAYSSDYVILMRSTGCTVQYWGITLSQTCEPVDTYLVH